MGQEVRRDPPLVAERLRSLRHELQEAEWQGDERLATQLRYELDRLKRMDKQGERYDPQH
jgi:hypothetical protein